MGKTNLLQPIGEGIWHGKMTDTGWLHQDVLLKQWSGVQTIHSGIKRTAHQVRKAVSVKGNRSKSNY